MMLDIIKDAEAEAAPVGSYLHAVFAPLITTIVP